MSTLHPLAPLDTAPIFPRLHAQLIPLNALSADEARRSITVTGPDALLAPLWRARAVMV